MLDRVIETFSRTDEWTHWQTEWNENRLSSLDCLRLQVGNLDIDEPTLLEFVRGMHIDPDFVRLQDWAARSGTELLIVSDNFELILREILRQNRIEAPRIFANALAFDGRHPLPSFPYRSPACARCANCKGSHFSRFPGARFVCVGDGLSDICMAMRADHVFAKDSLAAHLTAHDKPFTPFRNLGEVVRALAGPAPARQRVLQAEDCR